MGQEEIPGDELRPGELEEFNFFEWIEPILKYRWAFGLIVLVSVFLGIVYNIKAPRIYRAQSSVIIRQNIPFSVIREKEAELPEKVGGESDFNTKVKMVNSQPFLEELVRRLVNLGYFKDDLKRVKYEEMKPGARSQFIQELANSIRRDLEVTNPKQTNLVQVSYESPDPKLAKEVVNQLADIIMEFNKNEQLLIMQNSLAYLNQQLEDSKKRVADAEEKLYEYRREHNIFEADMDKQLMGQRRADLRQKLTDLQEQHRETEAKISQLKTLLERQDYTKYTPVLADNPVLQELSGKLVAEQVNYHNLLINYKPEHPEVIKSAGQVEVLKRQFEEELHKTLTKLDYDLGVLKSRERLLEEAFAETEKSAVMSTQNDIGYVVLEREAGSARDLYQTLLAAVKEVNINANSMVNNVVYIHEKAVTPQKPVKPQQAKNLLISLVLGIMLGAAFAYAREYIDQTIQTPDDVKRISRLPVLSAIPLYRSKNNEEQEVPLVVARKPKSLFSEGVTALRAHLNIKLPQEKPAALLVTSSSPKEGKSLIASNLALSMALSGKKTLLIDCDFHHPKIHKLFELDQHVGLYDLIVEALNPGWSDLDLKALSIGDIQHLVRLKQWSGTIRISWDSLPATLDISYKEGKPAGSNIGEWKENCWKPTRARPSDQLAIELDESEILELDGPDSSAKKALEFIHQHPRLARSIYFTEKVIPNYLKPSSHQNLQVLTVGTHPRAPSEILGSQQMNILVQLLKERYERIIIDSPPAWPLSDVSVLSPSIDGIIWICRTGVATKNVLKHGLQQVSQMQPNILGMVLNGVDFERNRYYYYGHYGYSSYYQNYYKSYYYHHDEEPEEAVAPDQQEPPAGKTL